MTMFRRSAQRLSLVLFASAAIVSPPAFGSESPSVAPAPVSGLAHPGLWPRAASPAAITDPATEARMDALIARMSVEEKVGQTIQADIASITPEDLRRYPLGALLAGGNSAPHADNRAPPADWLALIRAFRAVAAEARPGHTSIPLLFGIDAVHG
ncbi:MAG: 1,4-beta-D-glucan glucohydrolase, partial [Caulobacteraceae bacterium]|nr:1,4-beta-D-glucan glucohydrolase [Caulobacteraceae bacterium]